MIVVQEEEDRRKRPPVEEQGPTTYLCYWLPRPARYQCSACRWMHDNYNDFEKVKDHYYNNSSDDDDDDDSPCRGGAPMFEACLLPAAATTLSELAEKCSIGEIRFLDSIQCHPSSDIKTDLLRGCIAPSKTCFQEAAALVQVIVKEPNRLVATSSTGYDTTTTLLAYSKGRVWAWNPVKWATDDDEQRGTSHSPGKRFTENPQIFAKIPFGALNPLMLFRAHDKQSSGLQMMIQQHGGSQSDVFSMKATHLIDMVRPSLDDLAAKIHDRPVPKYHNLIDPNLFVRSRPDGTTVWVPSEFDVSPDGATVELVGGVGVGGGVLDRAHWMDRELIDATATPVLCAALPLLARLTKPCLLLQGQRLQVAIKAQRIELPPKRNEDDVSEYVGLWHVDGDHEPVAAVVLFYYHMDDDSLAGGALEFLDRQPFDVLGYGDTCNNNLDQYNRSTLRAALRPVDGDCPIIPNCTVPVKTGTMIVFSNYQMAHRVLRMINTSTQTCASRNFVALFILDPAARPLVPARIHLAKPAAMARVLAQLHHGGGGCGGVQGQEEDERGNTRNLPMEPIQLILEFAGVVPSAQSRVSTRNKLLRSQLKLQAHLTASGKPVCCIGNGCFTMIGWLNDMLAEDDDDEGSWRHEEFDPAKRRTLALNVSPR